MQREEKTEESDIKECFLECMTEEQDWLKCNSINEPPIREGGQEMMKANKNLTESISMEELSKAIKWIKNGKASGLDSIPNEMIKYLGESAQEAFLEIFNEILLNGTIPNEWKIIRVRPLHKGKGKVTNKYVTVLKKRLNDYQEEQECIGEIQNGFRKDRQFGDNIYTITQCLKLKK